MNHILLSKLTSLRQAKQTTILTVGILLTSWTLAGRCQSPGAKGAEILSTAEYISIPVAPQPVAGKLPDSFSLESLLPHAGFQGPLLDCTAWASTYNKAYRIYMASGRNGSPDQYIQSPMFVYSAITNNSCKSGTPVPTALRFLKAIGSVSLSELPYTESVCPKWRDYRGRAAFNSFAAYRLTDDKSTLLQEIRNHIIGGDPVIVAINACEEFNHPIEGSITRLGPSDIPCGGHAVLVVGYDDGRQAVRILNSWGDGWGDHGKVWMSYSVFLSRVLEAYVDLGPGGSVANEDAWLSEGAQTVSAPRLPTLSPEIIKAALRANIDPTIKRSPYSPLEKKKIDVSVWSIWLSLPAEYASQIKSADYYFLHSTFKHNPQQSLAGSSVFLAEWDGYGCVDDAYVIITKNDGQQLRSDFNHCQVVQASRPN